MGRVYSARPDKSKGEISGAGAALFVRVANGACEERLLKATRVEFDKDSDDGYATVTCYFTVNGSHVFDDAKGLVKVSFRCIAKIIPKTHESDHFEDVAFIVPSCETME